MLKLFYITAADASAFSEAFALYKQLIPKHKQRLLVHQQQALLDEAYHFTIIMRQITTLGLLLYWQTDAFLYVEHIAVLPEYQSKGFEEDALKQLCDIGLPVILETDMPTDATINEAMLGLEHAGFVKNNMRHMHPPYQKDYCEHELSLLSYPTSLTMAQYQAFYGYLATVVMAYAQKGERYERALFTNMCMLEDANGNVLVQNRLNPRWPGVAFPGGHVEAGESFVASVIREMKEETGLTVHHPVLCGIKQFENENGIRYCVLLFKANAYDGTLRASEEGNVYWVKKSELRTLPLAVNFEDMLPVFEDDTLSECSYRQVGDDWECVVY